MYLYSTFICLEMCCKLIIGCLFIFTHTSYLIGKIVIHISLQWQAI